MFRYAHERMNAYTKGVILVEKIYTLVSYFPEEEKFGLTSQMKRASISYVSNFVEGNARSSIKEKKRFYECGYGSLLELDCQTVISQKLFDLEDKVIEDVRQQIEELVKIISGLKRINN